MDGSSLKLPDESTLELNKPVPFKVRFDSDLIDITRAKLSLARYPSEQADFDNSNWSQGAKVAKVKALTVHWLHHYDYGKQQEYLNTTFSHFVVKIDVPGYGDLILHFTHAKSTALDATPLLFSHGWPGSFVEASKVVEPLSNPESPTDPSFHVVAPSIPGFGFSPASNRSGVGPEVTARAFKVLMTDVLGYRRFVTQGGDFGSFITRSMAIQYPDAIIGQHLNMFPVGKPTLWTAPFAYIRWCLSGLLYTDFEKEALRVRENFETDQSGYLEQQRTRAQTLGFSLGDSPIGLLAWFVEKFHDWGHVEQAFDPDTIITLVMMHWIQGATPGLRFYQEAFGARREAEKAFETYVGCPTGVSMYVKEQLHCPKDWAQRVANIHFWREHDVGGHFSSLECPGTFVKDIRQFISLAAVQKALKT